MTAPTIQDGGPAFPYAFHLKHLDGEPSGINLGLSLRDYFAAKAMNGYLSDPQAMGSREQFAEWAYQQADAMLAARKGDAT
jgi:hypothetical protein